MEMVIEIFMEDCMFGVRLEIRRLFRSNVIMYAVR